MNVWFPLPAVAAIGPRWSAVSAGRGATDSRCHRSAPEVDKAIEIVEGVVVTT
jgi:hypothetical protein